MFDRGLFLSLLAIRRQLAAMPQDLYLVRLIHQATRTAFPGERLWSAAQLGKEATVRFLRVRNREGCDVYIQPYRTKLVYTPDFLSDLILVGQEVGQIWWRQLYSIDAC